MELLKINPTHDSPEINLDPSGQLEFKGRSLPEDVKKFYSPVMDWVKEYLKAPSASTRLIFNLEYFNTASSKFINEMLLKFEELAVSSSSKVEVLWYYEFDDEDMLDIGREFKDNLKLPVELIPVEVTI
ncbi:MAG: DUF1987 domain-containing protein [Bacteroidota bacterium]